MGEGKQAAVNECVDQIGQVLSHPSGENSAGRDVVSVTKPAGYAKDLVAVLEGLVLDQPIDVDAFGNRSRPLEGVGGFFIAIGAGCT